MCNVEQMEQRDTRLYWEYRTLGMRGLEPSSFGNPGPWECRVLGTWGTTNMTMVIWDHRPLGMHKEWE